MKKAIYRFRVAAMAAMAAFVLAAGFSACDTGDVDDVLDKLTDDGNGQGNGKVATPTASPATGATLTVGDKVTLTAESGATIRYTFGATAPTSTTGTVYNDTDKVTLATAGTVTIKAIAVKAGMTDSDVLTATYTVEQQVVTLVADPADGATVTVGDRVTLTATPSDAVIRYTLDGSTVPTSATGTEYNGTDKVQLSTAGSVTLKAIAVKAGMTDSDVLTATYTVQAFTEEIAFAKTDNDTSNTSVNSPSGSGASQTATLSVVEEPAAFFQVIKEAGQTITVGGADAEKVTLITDDTLDGSTASDTAVLVSVNMEDLLFNGAFAHADNSSEVVPKGTETRTFTLTVSEPDKASRTITVNLNITLDGDTETTIYHREGTPGAYSYVKVRDAALTAEDAVNVVRFENAAARPAFEAYSTGPVRDLQNAFVWVDKHGEGGTEWMETGGVPPAGYTEGTTEGYSEYRLFLKKDQQIGKIVLSFVNSVARIEDYYFGIETDTRDSISIQLYGAGTPGAEKKITRDPNHSTDRTRQEFNYSVGDMGATGLITLTRPDAMSLIEFVNKYQTLILGKNITLSGGGENTPFPSNDLNGSDNTNPWNILFIQNLLKVSNNATLIIEDHAKITGVYAPGTTTGYPIGLEYSARLYMRGGAITDNTTDASVGVVYISEASSDYGIPYVKKTGGTVFNNTNNSVTKASTLGTVEGWD
jgi:hypothetical protein